MDDRERVEDQQPEDLEMGEEDAEQVRGGLNFAAIKGFKAPDGQEASPQLDQRGGWDGNHSEVLVRI
jgi:hypothetical protein